MDTKIECFLFYDGLTRKYGYKDKSNCIVISANFTYAFEFREDLALVLLHSKFGFINYKGEFIIPPIYALAQEFHEGLAAVSLDSEKWGYVNKQGKTVYSFLFDYAGDFENGLARVAQAEEWKLINRNGEFICTL